MRKNIKTTEAIFPMPVLMVATYNEDGTVNADYTVEDDSNNEDNK